MDGGHETEPDGWADASRDLWGSLSQDRLPGRHRSFPLGLMTLHLVGNLRLPEGCNILV